MIFETYAPEGYIKQQNIDGKITTYILVDGKIKVDTAPDGTKFEYDSKGKIYKIFHPSGWIEEKRH